MATFNHRLGGNTAPAVGQGELGRNETDLNNHVNRRPIHRLGVSEDYGPSHAQQLAWLFQVDEPMTITHVGFCHVGTVGSPTSAKLSLQGADTTVGVDLEPIGRPDGVIKSAGSAEVTFAPGVGGNTFVWYALGSSYAASRGEFLNIVLEPVAGFNDFNYITVKTCLVEEGVLESEPVSSSVSLSSSSISSSSMSSNSSDAIENDQPANVRYREYGRQVAGSAPRALKYVFDGVINAVDQWFDAGGAVPVFGYRAGATRYGMPVAGTVANGVSSGDFGFRFNLPALGSSYVLKGVNFIGTESPADATYTIKVWDTDGTTILHSQIFTLRASSVTSPGMAGSEAGLRIYHAFDSLIELNTDQDYYITGDGEDASWNFLDFSDALDVGAMPGGAANFIEADRSGGSFVVDDTRRVIAELELDSYSR